MITFAFAQENLPKTAAKAVNDTNLADATAKLDLLELFLSADWVVKIVIIALIITSIYCWKIIFEKWRTLKALQHRARKFRKIFSQAEDWQSFRQQLGTPRDPMSHVFCAISEEINHQKYKYSQWQRASADTFINPLNHAAETTIRRQNDILEKGLGTLATTASAAPFIGLFGTVWGIMNSFSAIAATNQTSLSVVAPGIAEALFATALGLIAAIPASIFYNKFSSDISRYMAEVENFAYDFTTSIKNLENTQH